MLVNLLPESDNSLFLLELELFLLKRVGFPLLTHILKLVVKLFLLFAEEFALFAGLLDLSLPLCLGFLRCSVRIYFLTVLLAFLIQCFLPLCLESDLLFLGILLILLLLFLGVFDLLLFLFLVLDFLLFLEFGKFFFKLSLPLLTLFLLLASFPSLLCFRECLPILKPDTFLSLFLW